MSEPNEELRETLQQLDGELQRVQPANDDQRQHLQALQRDVRALLDNPGVTSPADVRAINHRWTDSLEHFEATHPALTSLVEQVLNTLSNMGV